jgi:hypothetical protein
MIAPVGVAVARAPASGGADAVVIAILDESLSPYHWDYLASKMPQALNVDSADDLPLSSPADTWLQGFPRPSAFASFDRLDLHLAEHDRSAALADLSADDDVTWKRVQPSSAQAQHVYWLPGTKVIGAMAWAGPATPRGTMIRTTRPRAHGTGTTSVGVGNMHGSCPECLLFFIDIANAAPAEANEAYSWALRQPWIDVVSNSWGGDQDLASVDLQKAASERGQTTLFSAGNGIVCSNRGTYDLCEGPNNTLTSSHRGPDWNITVGAIDAVQNRNYTASGKPVDIASISGPNTYPSAFGATTVTGGEGFGGTSNAAPTIGGTYGRALYLARRALGGPSRVQLGGVVARGRGQCEHMRADCELADGVLTAVELRARLLQGATPSKGGFSERVTETPIDVPALADERYLSEGHGAYRGRIDGTAAWLREFDQRLWGPLSGTVRPPARPVDERDWMVVDSWCRQKIWGSWSGGYYAEGKSALPGPDAAAPVRTGYRVACKAMSRPPA